MNRKSGKINRLEIPKPCTASWEEMVGDDQVRFCSECNKRVYNLSAMTKAQADATISASRGQLCVRFTRSCDGTTQFADEVTPPPTLHQMAGRRASPVASAALSAMLTISPIMLAHSQTSTHQPASILAVDQDEYLTTTAQGASSNLRGTVQDVQKNPLQKIPVALMNENTGKVRVTLTNADGVYEFAGLSSGVYILKIAADGYEHVAHHGINLMRKHQQNLDVTMQPMRTFLGDLAYVPDPLRRLYTESDRIVIAALGKSVKHTKDKSGAMTTRLQVSATLKGEPKDAVDFFHYSSQYRENEFREGDKVIVFLERREGEAGAPDSYGLSSFGGAIKKFSDKELQSLVERLEHLGALYEADKLDLSEITEWLVRCVEDNVGRYDAAFELANGTTLLQYRKVNLEEDKSTEGETDKEKTETEALNKEAGDPDVALQQSKNGVQAEADSQQLVFDAQKKPLSEPEEIVLRLTPQQKERLMSVLFNTQEAKSIEMSLVRLAIAWRDERLVPFLLNHLRQAIEKPDRGVAAVIIAFRDLDKEDEEIATLMEEYAEIESDILRAEDEALVQSKKATTKEEKYNFPEAQQKQTVILEKFLTVVEKKFTKKESKDAIQK